jgi:hypothetical protein
MIRPDLIYMDKMPSANAKVFKFNKTNKEAFTLIGFWW